MRDSTWPDRPQKRYPKVTLLFSFLQDVTKQLRAGQCVTHSGLEASAEPAGRTQDGKED